MRNERQNVRLQARDRLEAALKGRQLTLGQLNDLRGIYKREGDIEVLALAGQVFKPRIAKLPAVQMILAKSDFYESPPAAPAAPDDITWFRLGELNGLISPLKRNEVVDFKKIKTLVKGLQQDIEWGETVDAKIKLTRLRNFINGLPVERFDGLFLRKNQDFQTQAQVSAMIQEAIDKIGDADTQINNAVGPPPPPGPRRKVPVPGPGQAPTGLSFELELPNVVAPGMVDLSFDSAEAFDLDSDPPDGYEFVGLVVSLIPDDEVLISDEATVGIHYSVDDAAIVNPLALQMVRVANGQVQFLDTLLNDLDSGVLYAIYQTDPAEPEQFGLFGLVQEATWSHLEDPSSEADGPPDPLPPATYMSAHTGSAPLASYPGEVTKRVLANGSTVLLADEGLVSEFAAKYRVTVAPKTENGKQKSGTDDAPDDKGNKIRIKFDLYELTLKDSNDKVVATIELAKAVKRVDEKPLDDLLLYNCHSLSFLRPIFAQSDNPDLYREYFVHKTDVLLDIAKAFSKGPEVLKIEDFLKRKFTDKDKGKIVVLLTPYIENGKETDRDVAVHSATITKAGENLEKTTILEKFGIGEVKDSNLKAMLDSNKRAEIKHVLIYELNP